MQLSKKLQTWQLGLCYRAKRLYAIPPLWFKRRYKYQISIAAIFQNEANYLKEWIEFHLLVGVEHFYLFNHMSSDHYLSVLHPYIERGCVELMNWPFPAQGLEMWNQIQCQAYEHALKRAKYQTKWLAFLDIDEFLFASQENSLSTTLGEYENYAGVCVNWQVFGTSKIAKIPSNQLLIEALCQKCETDDADNYHVKSIVRPEAVAYCENPHYVAFKYGFYQVDPLLNRFKGAFSTTVSIDKLRINHYLMRDEHYLYGTKLGRQKAWGQNSSIIGEAKINACNAITDKAILRFVPELHGRIFKDNKC